MIAYIVVKEKFATQFAQAADVFENFKFKGYLLRVKAENGRGTPRQLYDSLTNDEAIKECPDQDREIVGVLMPNKGSVIKQGHKVYSDGEHWCLIEDLVKQCGADPLEYVE